ncbi:mandelate racemase/muconate lactonizing enzyme family protein [Stutzerimonas stutzeri]|jgi:L-alanine-DL-glutamate epimerase-like enolase superfamily enzyme|uniref:Mandelate racemase/muconate lactonizing enzyme family protein n=1 Tax=Stutzerimonas stutzeri TaxID=316 RepID=A0ABD4Y6Y7_STUST|nr:mandelate racemase/muconate lactonizing enzyme family protein [Stutzerimonas stutzeri]AWK99300.1 mandelate racemase/muconate lactonizing enzyme family protein [Stutzerimonas stutzeri]MDH0690759.1 mandelate racemase/muconate lactonizing enzyme family protein [Stutzerimonas stutzeri]UNL98454.1 mandelate racemase/muconate lactonizing enzyme family protein [Stutzerimonas stutzeri]
MSDIYEADRISWIGLRAVELPLARAVSDAKVATGRQQPLDAVSLLIVELQTQQGHAGLGFSYSLRTGGPAQYIHARELAPLLLGEDPNDIARLCGRLGWASASIGRCGLALQSIAAFDTALWDLKARRAGLPLAKLLGAQRDAVPCYNTSGGYLQAPIEEVIERAEASLARGIGGIKLKVGQPNRREDLRRVRALREALGADVALMVDVNQQWDRTTALRMGRALEELELAWIEEPLDAHDLDGHAALAAQLVTPVGSGEMLASAADACAFVERGAVDVIMHDAPRIGGITPFLQVAEAARRRGLVLAPHFVMELHIHLAAAYEHVAWVEHFEWLEPLFEERLEISGGCIQVPTRLGLGLSLSERVAGWTLASDAFGRRG